MLRISPRHVVSLTLFVLCLFTFNSHTPAFNGALWDLVGDHFDHADRPEAPCVAFLVQDAGVDNSTILRADLRDPITGDPDFFDIDALSICPGCDVEATGLDTTTGVLYGIAGGVATSAAPLPQAGQLFTIDKTNGDFTVIGSTGATGSDEIVSASFRSEDDTLWAFQQSVGLVVVNTTNASTALQFDIVGVTDQFGAPVGDNWEGLAWNLAGTRIYGTDGAVLYRWNPVTTQVTRVCSNLAAPGGMVEALEFTTDGRLIGSRHLDDDRTLIEIELPGIFTPDLCDVDPIELPSGPLADDIESLTFEACNLPASSCDVGRPQALVFEYTGQSCAATTNYQSWRFFCIGDPNGAQPVRVDVGLFQGAVAVPSTQTVNVGDQFTIQATGSRLGRNTWIKIKQGFHIRQKVSIHTSCSQPLEIGDQFGSLILRDFIPEP